MFGSPSELGACSCDSSVRLTVAEQVERHDVVVTGRVVEIESFDMPAVRAIERDAAANDYRISSIIMGVVNSAAFQMNRIDAEAPAGGGTR